MFKPLKHTNSCRTNYSALNVLMRVRAVQQTYFGLTPGWVKGYVSLLHRFQTGGPTYLVCTMRYFSRKGGGGRRRVKLITHLDPIPRMRISGATLPLPHMYSRRARWQRLRKKWNITDWYWVITWRLHGAENKFEDTWFEFKTSNVYSKFEVLTGVLMEIQTSRHVNF